MTTGVGLVILFTVELVGSYYGHAPTSSGKFVYDMVSFTDQLYGKLTCLDIVHALFITDLFASWACSFLLMSDSLQQ